MFLGHWLPNIHNNISKNTKRRKKKRWSGQQWLWSMLLECFLDGSMSHHHTHLCYFSAPKHLEESNLKRKAVRGKWKYEHTNMGTSNDVIYQQHETYRVREKAENPTKSYVNLKSLYCFLWRGSIGSLWLDREDEEALYKFINTHKQKTNTFWLEQLHKIETVKKHFLQFSMIKLKFKVVTTLTPVC